MSRPQGSVFDLLGDLEFAAGLGQPAYGAAFAATRRRHRADEGLTVLAFAGGELVVGRLDRPVGATLRVRVRAEDVMLAREEPRAISANNVLRRQRSRRSIKGAGAQADVQLDCGGAKLVARITRASVARLELAPGIEVFAIVKSVTVDPRILPAPESLSAIALAPRARPLLPRRHCDCGETTDAPDPLCRYRRAAGRRARGLRQAAAQAQHLPHVGQCAGLLPPGSALRWRHSRPPEAGRRFARAGDSAGRQDRGRNL